MSDFGISVKPDPRTAKLTREIAQRFPREMQRAAGRTASIIARQLRASLRSAGGKNGVPRWANWHPLTELIRSGMAMTDLQKQIVVRSAAPGVYNIGWVDGLQDIARGFHAGNRYAFEPRVKGYLKYRAREKGGSTDVIDDMYQAPERRLYEPYNTALRPEKVRQWMLGNVRKMIEKTAARYGK